VLGPVGQAGQDERGRPGVAAEPVERLYPLPQASLYIGGRSIGNRYRSRRFHDRERFLAGVYDPKVLTIMVVRIGAGRRRGLRLSRLGTDAGLYGAALLAVQLTARPAAPTSAVTWRYVRLHFCNKQGSPIRAAGTLRDCRIATGSRE